MEAKEASARRGLEEGGLTPDSFIGRPTHWGLFHVKAFLSRPKQNGSLRPLLGDNELTKILPKMVAKSLTKMACRNLGKAFFVFLMMSTLLIIFKRGV